MAKTWDGRSAPHRTLHTGDRGEDVKRLQTALRARSGLNVTPDGEIGPRTLVAWRAARYLGGLPTASDITPSAQAAIRWPWSRTPQARVRAEDRALKPERGALYIVQAAVHLAEAVHPVLYVVSAYRPNDPMDHGGNGFSKAARDIAHPRYDALEGPPQPELDDAAVVIGHALGRDYEHGREEIDTWHVGTWRLQLIWRTSKYGGHLGHIHMGCKND